MRGLPSFRLLLVVLVCVAACSTSDRSASDPPQRERPGPSVSVPSPSEPVATGRSDAEGERTAHPVVDATHGHLFGATGRGGWLPPDSAVAFVEAETTYRLYTLDRSLGEATGGAASPPRETCANPTVEIDTPPGESDDIIGVAGDWNVLPRVPSQQNPNQPAYEEFVAAQLREHGIPEPDVHITQLLRIDLEGDGTDEVLLSANRTGGLGTSARAGDYGLVLLRKVVDGEAVTVPIVEEYYPEECIAECAPMEYRVVAVLDLDGDGRQEPVIGYRYYEGAGMTVYSIEGQRTHERLSWACGV